MRIVLAAALVATALSTIAPPAFAAPASVSSVSATESERLNEWFEERFEELLQFSPLGLAQLGRKEQYDELDDFSPQAEDEQLAWYKATVEDLERSFDYNALSAEDQLSYDLWRTEYRNSAEAARWRGNSYVFTQMQGIHTALPSLMISIHRVDTAEDMEAYISRIGQFDRALGQLVDRAEANAANGVRPPAFAYDAVLGEARKLIDGAPFTEGADTPLWQDGKAKIAALVEPGTIDEARAEQFRAQLEQALTTSYRPGYERLIAFMQRDQPNAPAVATGVGSLPNGADYYANRLATYTTTDLTAEEIHQIGLDEIARIRGEMEAIKTELGYTGTLQQFFAGLRDAEWNYYPDTDEGRQAYLDDATAAIDNIERELPNWFGILPKGELVVRRVEPFREQDGAAQHYRSGTPDGSRPGVYYVHLSDMSAVPKNQMEVIAYHEGLPGHHMQIAIAQELGEVPEFRTQFGYSVYSEGWGLYAEKLASEMPGTYRDPYSRFGRLTSEMWRAVRLVVDTGLHAKGWTEEEAIAFFQENSPEPLESIRSEVRRYIVWPGQATSYKIGMMRIEALRAEAEAELGAAFDIRAFHDTILGGGAMPLPLLEQRVRTWIANTKAG